MERDTYLVGDEGMTIANRQASAALTTPRRILIIGGAGLLILAGLVLQLGMLSYGHIQSSHMWIASTVVESAWSMLILQMDAQGVHAVATFWPMLLISTGLAILLLARREAVQAVPSGSRGGQNHAQ